MIKSRCLINLQEFPQAEAALRKATEALGGVSLQIKQVGVEDANISST